MPQRDAVFPANPMLFTKPTAIQLPSDPKTCSLCPARSEAAAMARRNRTLEIRSDWRLTTLKATLLAAGCGFDDIVDVTTFHTDPENQFETIIAVKNEIFKQAPYPNWTAIGVNWLAGFDFEIKVIARIPSRTSASVSRRNPPTMWDMASVRFSHISVAEPGRLAFLSGQIAAKPGSEDAPKDLAGQAKLATASLAAALEELEASAQDIVMLRVYVVNATTEAFQQVLPALRELLGDAMPSITTIGVQALYTPEIKVEIEMVVRLP